MNEIIKIPVYMLSEDAKKFILFQQYYNEFAIMLENNVFNIKNGKVEIHFDSLGQLQTIHRSDILYDRRFDKKLSTDL